MKFIISLSMFLLLFTACGAPQGGDSAADEPGRAAKNPELVGTNWDGERFDLTQVRGRVAVIFYGYTLCPDVCPFTLAKLKQVRAALGDRGDEMAVVFVSVDPGRDSLERLAEYVPGFDEDFYGIRLEFDEVEMVRDEFALTVQYGQPKDGPGTKSYYYVDHTGTYFILDQEGELKNELPPNASEEMILEAVETLLDGGGA